MIELCCEYLAVQCILIETFEEMSCYNIEISENLNFKSYAIYLLLQLKKEIK